MLTVIKHVVDDNIIRLSATQLMHAPAQHSSTAAAQNPNFISAELWLQQARAEFNGLQDLKVYSSMTMSCKSTKFTKSISDW